MKELREEIAGGGLVDEHLQDQLVVFQALAGGRSQASRGKLEPSLHTLTARWVAEQILEGFAFGADGSCEGVAFVAGTRAVGPEATDDVVTKAEVIAES